MNKHVFWDNLSVSIPSFFIGKNKFFSKSIESPTIKTHIENIQLENIQLELPEIKAGVYHEVTAKTLVGKLEGAFYVGQWLGEEYPTIIYHHGNGERPFDFGTLSKNTFKHIFISEKQSIKANLIALRAPYHINLREYMNESQYLTNFTAMISVSVKLIEVLVLNLKNQTKSDVIISGISLGGWITNLHRSYFNTADQYIPIFAGAGLGDAFIKSVYKKMTGQIARENPDIIKNVLNFDKDFIKIKDNNVFPLMALYDQIIVYDQQKRCYEGRDIKVLNKGHTTGTLSKGEIRQHILSRIR